jgi:hypothetical protein
LRSEPTHRRKFCFYQSGENSRVQKKQSSKNTDEDLTDMNCLKTLPHFSRVHLIFRLVLALFCLIPSYTAHSQEADTGSVVAWGNNSFGQLKLPNPNKEFMAVSAGDTFNLNLKTDGSIVALTLRKIVDSNFTTRRSNKERTKQS